MSLQQAAHANRELNLEGLIRGHDVDAAALNKSTNPGAQSKQQIGRVARAREAVDNMLKRWLVPVCARAISHRLRLNISVFSHQVLYYVNAWNSLYKGSMRWGTGFGNLSYSRTDFVQTGSFRRCFRPGMFYHRHLFRSVKAVLPHRYSYRLVDGGNARRHHAILKTVIGIRVFPKLKL